MQILKNLLLSTSFIVIYLIIGLLFYGEHAIMLLFMLISSFVYTYILYKKKLLIKYINLIFIILPFELLLLLTGLIGADFSRLLLYILFVPILATLGYVFYIKKSFLIILISLILSLIANNYLQPNLLYYFKIQTKHAYLENQNLPKIKFLDSNLNEYNIPATKIVVINFWTTSCSVCYQKFSLYNKLFETYKNEKNVLFLAANVQMDNETRAETITASIETKLKFKTIFCESQQETQNALTFNTYPHTVILKNNKVIYNGYIEPINSTFTYNCVTVEKLIKSNLDE
jgi:thiol-disulfide isomerase/thioredoxin